MSAPKYVEIQSALRARCSSLAIGTKLTAERRLAQEFQVSTMTIRQSLTKLAEEGWVRRAPGSGTYVIRPTVVMGPTLTSFSEDMRRLGLQPSAEVLRFEHISPDLETITHLHLRAGEDAILLERLRLADGEPMCHEIGIFPGRLASSFPQEAPKTSIHEMLATHKIVPYSTSRLVRAMALPEYESRLLKLPEGSPCLEIIDTFSDAQHQPIQYVRSRYRFDRYEVLSRIERSPR